MAGHDERLDRIRRAADYPLTFVLINPLNRRLVGPVARLGVSPNAVTYASLVIAMIAGLALYYAAQGMLWARIIAPLLVFCSHVCDALDGDLARYTDKRSRFGASLDPILDRVCEFVWVFAVAAGLWRHQGEVTVWLAAMPCISGALIYYYTTAQVSRVIQAVANDPRLYGFKLGSGPTKVKLGLYEVFLYGLAVLTSLGVGLFALWLFAAAFWLGWLGQMVKLWRVSSRE